MRRPRLRALVLAAGRGERLRPLTTTIPKPLLPVAGRPLAAWTLERLRQAGVEAAALNVHHLGASIRATFGASFRGMPLVWSEERELLGTGGALPPLRDFLADSDLVLVVNGDSLCRWPLVELVAAHLRREARGDASAVTVLLQHTIDPRPFGGGVAVEDGRVVRFRPGTLSWAAARRHAVFAGAQVIEPSLLPRLADGPSDLVDALYHPLLDEGATIRTLETARRWHDVGTARRYRDAALDWTFHGSSRAARALPGAVVAPTARLKRTIVEAGARVGDGAGLTGCLVLPGAECGSGAKLAGSIVGPGAKVEAGERGENRLYVGGSDGTTVAVPL